MRRILPWVLFAYVGLSAAQCSYAARRIYAPPPSFWCGNVISDAYRPLVRYIAPLAALAAGILVWGSLKARRWSLLAVMSLFAFVATTAALLYEGRWLEREYGIDGLWSGVWWLPRW